MKTVSKRKYLVGGLIGLALAGWLCQPGSLAAATDSAEEKFDVLETKTRSYTNVTVMSKEASYIFITHSRGLTSVNVADLSSEVRQRLGYVEPEKPKHFTFTNNVVAWTKETIAKMETPQVKEWKAQAAEKWSQYVPEGGLTKVLPPALMVPRVLYCTLGIVLLVYLFFCNCCRLICRKAGKEPGPLVWLPVLQIFPMLRAANMSYWWFLALFIPVLDLLAVIIWAVKIADARSKTVLVAILLLLPVINIFAFLFLAYSDSMPQERKPKEERPRTQLMTLDTAG